MLFKKLRVVTWGKWVSLSFFELCNFFSVYTSLRKKQKQNKTKPTHLILVFKVGS